MVSTEVGNEIKATNLGTSPGPESAIWKETQFGLLQLKADANVDHDISSVQKVLIERLAAKGYTAVANVGKTIDLAVLDPKDPTRFVLGIMCDGPSAFDIPHVRERERLLDEVLHARGWSMLRLYTPEVFSSIEHAVNRITNSIDLAQKKPLQSGNLREVRQVIEREEQVGTRDVANVPLYKEADLKLRRTEGRPLWSMNVSDLALYSSKVVREESPVHTEEVYLRLRQAADAQHSESLMRAFTNAIDFLIETGSVREAGGFLYSLEQKTFTARDRNKFGSSRKRIELVAPEERKAAVEYVVRYAHGIKPSELPRAALWALGFRTATETAEAAMALTVRELVEHKNLKQEGDFLYPA